MAAPRRERQAQKRREALERALAAAPGTLTPVDLEAAFFFDHPDLVAGLGEVLQRQGLVAAFEAYARHLEEERDLALRRLARIEADPPLRALRAAKDEDLLALLAAHFRAWGAAGVHGERVADLEAALALAALRNAERAWVRGNGRPVLPVLVQEALAVLWPALYAHARRHGG
ncbi:hypothetical protein [Mesoterricola sediminis]|uniref:Uncharacterized protein n=1 Tax=Mesoterricola sediminis TaxID=2927980 RepID=A0AA48KEX1_9BACT|nr:hypothetical protein [Mesoterricola sediminis]BDU77722.1 hypothetical protein METESE_26800 [Mesoterricola sediminis]